MRRNSEVTTETRKPGAAKLLRRLGLSLLLLVVIEVVLRLVGFGGFVPVLSEVATGDGVTYSRVDHDGVARFFDSGRPGSTRHGVLAMPKASGTIRIFLLGDSAIFGYPQGRHLCAAAFLETMLGDLWPDRDVEIINLGSTGVASFPVMCVADEALEYDPDLFIVWTGTNEYYGTYGVASAEGVGTSTWLMHLRHAATGLAIMDAVWTGMARIQIGGQAKQGTLMDRMIGVASIPPDDERRETAARNLDRHLRHIMKRSRARGVPVILCTLPANERDMPPIGIVESMPLSAAERSSFDEHLARARGLVDDDPALALEALKSAHDIYDRHALVEYLTGRCLSALGENDEAAKAYRRARDLDPMPWRPPSGTVDAIRNAAKSAILCDLEGAFRRESPDGVIGWELLVDQVHPNLRGQVLAARTMLESMTHLDGPLHVDPIALAALPSAETYFARLGANPFDEYVALEAVARLFESNLFTGTREASLEHTHEEQRRLRGEMTPEQWETVRQWLAESGERPDMPVTAALASGAQAQGRNAEASRLWRSAEQAVGDTQSLFLQYGWRSLFASAQVDPRPTPELLAMAREMIDVGERLRLLPNDEQELLSIELHLGLMYKYVGSDAEAIRYLEPMVRHLEHPGDMFVVNALVDSLVKTNQLERARAVLRTDLANPELKARCQMLLQQLGQ